MKKILKYVFIVFSVSIGVLGTYFYISFKNIHFEIKNSLSTPIYAYITIHSQDTDKDYTYPIMSNQAIAPNKTSESFYTLDESLNGTVCKELIIKDDNKEVVKTLDCPKEDDLIIIQK